MRHIEQKIQFLKNMVAIPHGDDTVQCNIIGIQRNETRHHTVYDFGHLGIRDHHSLITTTTGESIWVKWEIEWYDYDDPADRTPGYPIDIRERYEKAVKLGGGIEREIINVFLFRAQ